MKNKGFYISQMERDGFIAHTDAEIELYKLMGTKDYKRLSQVGFNMAYAERCLHVLPKHGSYQADMLHTQALAENIMYTTLTRDGYNKKYIDGFLQEFTEEALFEDIRQRVAYMRLEETIRCDASSCDFDIDT